MLCDAAVTSIELDGDKATGVNFTFGGKKHNVKLNREAIVSCGALQSPQILELSGIGDPEVLKAAGVECKIENKAVGANFQDHSMTASLIAIFYACSKLTICYSLWDGKLSLATQPSKSSTSPRSWRPLRNK